ncbi:MAG: hypothetical protein AB7G68_06945 [Nitrospiraceae bacterium]
MNPRDLTLGRRPPDGAFISHREHGFLIVLPVQAGRMLIAGYGPELHLFQDLGKAFERAHPGSAVDFEWDRTVKAASTAPTKSRE